MSAYREPPPLDRLVGVPVRRGDEPVAASDVVGRGLDGHPARVVVHGGDRWTLLLFLSSDCEGCAPFWRLVAGGDDNVLAVDDLVAVVHDDGREDPGHLKELATATWAHRVVMSSDAWRGYRVLGPPFAVLVDGTSGTIATEAVAWSPQQVAADVERARSSARDRSSR